MTFDELWRLNLTERGRADSVDKAEAVGLLAVLVREPERASANRR
jgi:hypothetical protein